MSPAAAIQEARTARRLRPKRLPGWTAPAVVPKHVQHCHAGTGSRLWWIYTWRPDLPESRIRVPYSCNSWRCEACAPHEAAVLFSRITEACKPLDAKGFVFIVLTLDQRGYFDKREDGWRRFRDVREAYRELGKQSQYFLYRVRRWMKREGMKPIGSEWFAVVEAHRSGWPHMNLVIHSPELAERLDLEQAELRAAGQSKRESILLRGKLRKAATGAGWGVQSTAERARDRDALAGYVTKLAGMSDATAGEVAKITQAPTAAPVRFRRLRSGKGFLPPRKGTADGWTGALVRRQRCNDGFPVVLPLHRCSPEHAEQVAGACYLEERIWQEEEEALYRKRAIVARYGPAAVLGPSVTYWDGDRQLNHEQGALFHKPGRDGAGEPRGAPAPSFGLHPTLVDRPHHAAHEAGAAAAWNQRCVVRQSLLDEGPDDVRLAASNRRAQSRELVLLDFSFEVDGQVPSRDGVANARPAGIDDEGSEEGRYMLAVRHSHSPGRIVGHAAPRPAMTHHRSDARRGQDP